MTRKPYSAPNYDDPVEHLAPPAYLGNAKSRVFDKQLGASVGDGDRAGTRSHLVVNPTLSPKVGRVHHNTF